LHDWLFVGVFAYHVWVALFIDDLDVIEFDVKELIDRDKDSCDGQVVLELNRHGLTDQCLEE
jgi:hypothetical protein